MRPSRHILLLAFLVAALATQHVFAQLSEGSPRFEDFRQVVSGARQFVRRIERHTDRTSRCSLRISPRLTLRRLRTAIATLVSQHIPRMAVSPMYLRLPPPAVA